MSTLLIKFPSRERPAELLRALGLYVAFLDDPANTCFLFAFDSDDPALPQYLYAVSASCAGISYEISVDVSRSKVHAINRCVEDAGDWHIVLLASDDMHPQVQGYDTRIREAFAQHYRDTDGSLWISDGRQDRINTIQCLGRKYFERDGYLYNPSYVSLWCDNEATEVAMSRGKITKLPCLIKNMSPDWSREPGTLKRDALYRKNNSLYEIDQRTYLRRKALGFPNP